MATQHLVIRADATADIGAGHVMRCCSLAESWLQARYGDVTLVGSVTIPFARARVEQLGLRQLEAGDLQGLQDATSVLLVDHYSLAERTSAERVGAFRARVLVDDLGGTVPPGYDAVWNPNAYSDNTLYPEFGGLVIGGPECVPVRQGLPTWRSERRNAAAVSLGGGIVRNEVAGALTKLAKHRADLEFIAVGEWVPEEWTLLNADTFWTDAAKCARLITAAGSTVWEAAAVGIPVCVLCTAENQRLIFDWVRSAGVPAILANSERTEEQILVELLRALPLARALPTVANGSPAVAARIRAVSAG